jgi:hypothetical protein
MGEVEVEEAEKGEAFIEIKKRKPKRSNLLQGQRVVHQMFLCHL